jgi:L-lactate dehydrogenase (cytochrome)
LLEEVAFPFVLALLRGKPSRKSLACISLESRRQKRNERKRPQCTKHPRVQRWDLSVKSTTCIEDLRQAAARKTPRAFFDFVEGGSYTERTLQANSADFECIKLRQRVLIDVANRSMRSTILGEPVSLPLALAPVGLCGMLHGDGEILACRAAQAAGILFCLSTMSVCSIEDVAAAVKEPFWFQMFFMKDRGFVRSLVERASAAKCSALVVTLDLPAIGQRHRDIRNGMGMPPKPRFKTLLDIATKPAWAFGIARGKRRTLGNLAGQIRGAESLESLSQWIGTQFNAPLSWNDVEWLAGLWPGKLILKGILDVEDARIAAKSGAASVVVSNHGGRQLDGAPSSISVLPAIADAVGSSIEILFDGGIRSGQDIMRAIALGARGCLSGRAYIYGLGAGGQAGVTRAIEILRNELDVTMALTGVTNVADIDRRVIAWT